MALIKIDNYFLNSDHIVSIEPLYQDSYMVYMTNNKSYKVAAAKMSPYLPPLSYGTTPQPPLLTEQETVKQEAPIKPAK